MIPVWMRFALAVYFTFSVAVIVVGVLALARVIP